MNKSIEVIAKGLEVQIQDKQILGNETQLSLELESGQKLKVLKKLNKDSDSFDDLIVIKDGQDLILTYADGSTLTIKGFYNIADLTLELPVSENEMHLLSSNVEGSSFSVLYAQGDLTLFESLFEGNDVALHALSQYSDAMESGLNAGAETAAVGTTAGMSTASLVVGGLLVAGGIAAMASGSSSSNAQPVAEEETPVVEEETPVVVDDGVPLVEEEAPEVVETFDNTANFVDSAVEGVRYVRTDADGNEIATGITGENGSFDYNDGETIIFEIENANGAVITLGSIDASEIVGDTVMPQDIVGVDRDVTNNADVQEMAQLLQSLDSDGDASNGISITDAKVEEFFGNLTADYDLTGADNVIDTKVDADSKSDLVSAEAAQAHLNTTTKSLDSTITTDASASGAIADLLKDINVGTGTDVVVTGTNFNIADLNALQTLIGTGTITLTAADTILGTVADLVADTTFINASTDVLIYDAATIAQITALQAKSSGTVDSDIDVNGTGDGELAITDTAANLLADAAATTTVMQSDSVVTISDAITATDALLISAVATDADNVTLTSVSGDISDVIALGTNHIVFTNETTVEITDNASVGQIETLANAGAVVTNISYSLTGALGDFVENTTLATFTVDADNATVVEAASSLNVTSASISDLTKLDAIVDVNVTATTVSDTAVNIIADGGTYVVDGVNIVATDASIAQIKTIDGMNGDGSLSNTLLSDTAANLIANSGNYVEDDSTTAVFIEGEISIAQFDSINTLAGTVTPTYDTVKDTFENIYANLGKIIDNNVIITDTVSVTEAQDIGTETAGAVTATISAASIAGLNSHLSKNVTTSADENNNAYTITITDITLPNDDAITALIELSTYTTLDLNVSTIKTVNASTAKIAELLGTDGITFADSVKFTPSLQTGTTGEDAGDLVTLAEAMGTLDASTVSVITGTIAELKAALEADNITYGTALTVEVTGTGAEIATDFTDLAALTVDGTTLTFTAGTNNISLIGTVAEVDAAITAMDAVGITTAILKAGTEIATEIKALDEDTDSGATVVNAHALTKVTGTSAEIADALNGTALVKPASYTAELTAGAEIATNITALDTLSGAAVKIDASAVTSIEGSSDAIATAIGNLETTPTATFTVVPTDADPLATDLTILAETANIDLDLSGVTSIDANDLNASDVLEAINAVETADITMPAVYTVTLEANTNTSVDIAHDATALTALFGKTGINLVASAVDMIAGTIDEINTAVSTVGIANITTAYTAVLSAGTEVATDITTLGLTDSENTVVNGAALTSISGTITEINTALTHVTPSEFEAILSAGTEVATELTTLLGVADTVDASAVTEITGSLADINTALATFTDGEDTLPTEFTATLAAEALTATAITTFASSVDGMTVDASNVTAISGTLEQIEALQSATNITLPTDYPISVTDITVDAAELTTLATTNGSSIVTSASTNVEGTVSALITVIGSPLDTVLAGTEIIYLTDVAGTKIDPLNLSIIDNKNGNNAVVIENAVNIEGPEAAITLALLGQSKIDATEATVTVEGTIIGTAAEVNKLDAIDNVVDGAVEATITASDASVTAAAINAGTNAYTITVTEATVNASDLSLLAAATSIAVIATDVTTITGSAAEIKELQELTTSDITLSSSVVYSQSLSTSETAENILFADTNSSTPLDISAVTTKITGTVEEINDILDAVTAGTITGLAANIGFDIDDAAETDIAATDLETILSATTGTVDVTTVINIQGTYAAVEDILVDLAHSGTPDVLTLAGNPTIEISGGITVIDNAAGTDISELANVNNLFGTTTGAITADVTVSAANAANLGSGGTDVLNITLNTDLTADAAPALAEVIAIDALTAGTITLTTADTAQAFTGTVAELTQVLTVLTASTGTLTTVTTTATAADLAALGELTSDGQVVDASSIVGTVDGTLAEITAAFVTAATKVSAPAALVTINDTSATIAIADLAAINNTLTGVGTLTVTATSTITGSLSDLEASLVSVTAPATSVIGLTAADNAFTVTDSLTIADTTDINAIEALTTGVVTATISGEAAVLGNATTGLDASSSENQHAYTITLSGTGATALELAAVNYVTSVIVDATSVTTISSDVFTEINAVITDLNADEIELAANWNLTSAADLEVAELATINNANGTGTISLSTTTALLDGNAGTGITADNLADAFDGFTTDAFTLTTANTVVSDAATVDQITTLTDVLVSAAGTAEIDVSAGGIVIEDEATFDLSGLGDLTGLAEVTGETTVDIDASSTSKVAMTITLADLVGATDVIDGTAVFLDIAGTATTNDALKDTLSLDASVWTDNGDTSYTATSLGADNGSSDTVYTINVDTNVVVTVG